MADKKEPEKNPEAAPLRPADNDTKKLEQFQLENGDDP